MPHVEKNALNRKIRDTQKALSEISQMENSDLRMMMSSELEARLAVLLEESEILEKVDTKETVSLRIYGEKVKSGKVSSRVLLDALNGFQSMVDSVANAMLHSPTSRGKIPERIKEITTFEIVGTFAGSFGLTMDEHTATEIAYKNGYEQGLRDAVRWIPVEERLPNDEKPVLAYYGFPSKESGEMVLRFMGTLSYLCFEPKPHWQHESTGLAVTHWMTLPDPPKEGE